MSATWDGRDMNNREVKSGVYFIKVNGIDFDVKIVKLR